MRSVRSSLSIGRLAIYPRNSNIRTGKFPCVIVQSILGDNFIPICCVNIFHNIL